MAWPPVTAPQPTFNLISINYDNVWLHSLNVVEGWMLIGKNSLNNIICHLSWLEKLSPTHTHPLISIHEFSKPCELLLFELESLIKCWMWIGKKIHSIILSVTCHGFRNFPLLIHIPSQPFMNFWNPASYYFWVRVTHKMLNVKLGKNSLNNLSLTCHGLRNFPLLIHIPSQPFVNFQNPMSYYFLS